MKLNTEFLTTKNNIIRTSLFYNSNPENLPAVILVHGFKGFKDWGYGNYLGAKLADEGFLSILFNFSHNGIGEDLENFTEPEKFANNTISLEVEELGEVIDRLKIGGFGFLHTNTNLCLIGHSRGGAVSIIKTAEDERISILVSWASVSTFYRYTPRQIKEWEEKGYLELINTRTNQIMRLNRVLLDDFRKNEERFNLIRRMSEIKVPKLIVHGDLDISVQPKEAYELYEAADKNNCELYIVEKTNHTFDIIHPFAGTSPKFEDVINKSINFIKTNLK